MNCSETITKLAVALAKAQGEIENAGKKSVNPHFKSKYADLAEIVNTARPVLTRHGISLIQIPSYDGQVASVETILLHESGEWLSGISSSPLQKADPQGIGSATTYLRRYAAAAMCFLAQEDDDANSASKSTAKQATKEPKVTEHQLKNIRSYFEGTDEQDILDYVWGVLNAAKPMPKLKALNEITSRMADFVLVKIEEQIKSNEEQKP